MPVTDDYPWSPYDIRHASAQVCDEESLCTPRGTRPIDARWIGLEWRHGGEEPFLEVRGVPLFRRSVRYGFREAKSGDDPIVRRFRPSDYGGKLPDWITDFYQRHDPNPSP